MATKSKQPDHCSGSDAASLDSLKEQVTRLQSELEAERKLTRQLRREKSYDLQKTRELEQTKASIALKDLRAKLHQERIQELELQKEALNKRYDLDLQKVVRQKDAEINKLRSDLRKCQDELEQTRERATNRNNSGLSATSARGAFDAERQKLLTDIQELRTARRHLENELRTVTEAERQRCREIHDLKSQLRIETTKIQKEADTEIKRLLEELRSKDRQSWQKQKESSTQTDYLTATKLLMDTPPVSPDAAQLANGVRENGETESTITGSALSESKAPMKKDPGGVLQQKVKELTSRVRELEEEKQSLAEDKTQLLQKIKDMEKKHRTTLEKNKRFLEKNIEVTNINRSLEEKIKKLNDELNKLRSQSEKFKKEQDKLSEQLSSEKVDKQTLAELRAELEDLREQAEHQEKTITALKMACNEKDRRIELLVHKRRKQKNSKIQQKMVRFILPAKTHSMASGLKETYYGYDEDTTSIDSEMSSTSCLSSSHLSLDTSNEEDDVFDEVTRSDLERSYQRLMKEHLELEKSYALLQAKTGASHIDPQRDNKDMGWFEEKETLTKTIRMLKDKIKNQEAYERRMTNRISEIQEQNEELEFRILELEELNDKLKEDVSDTITIKEPPQMTDDGVLQMYAEEKGLMEIKLETIREKLHDLNYSKDGHLDKADKLVLLQARAMLAIADKKLKDLTTTQDLLKARIKKLEAEKVELLSAATGVSADLVFEYEETRKKLEEAEQKIKELEEQMEKYKETEAVYKYTEEQNERVQSEYRKEISNLHRQLSNSYEGREYESELWHETLEKIKSYERRIQELEAESEPLKERVELLQIENSHLQCGLTQLQCENSRLQCENTQLLQAGSGENAQLSQADSDEKTRDLESKIEECEKVISDHVGKNKTLEDEIKVCKEKLNMAEKREEEYNKKTADLEKDLKETLDRCCHLESEIENIRAELLKELQLEGKDTNVHSGVKLLIKQVQTLSEEKEALQKKVSELSEKNSHLLQQLEEKASLVEELKQKLNTPQVRDVVQDKAADNELLEDNNKLKEDNRKLCEDIKKLKEDKNRLEEKNSRLQENNKSLNEDNERLKEQLEKTQKDAENEIIQLNTQSRTLIEKVKSLELKLKESRDEELKMKDSIVLMEEEKSRYIQHLQSQLDQTEENESQLCQTISELKEKEKTLMEELNKKEQSLRDKMAAIQAEDKEEAAKERRKLQEKVKQLEKREEELVDMTHQLEEMNRSLKVELDQIHKAEVKVTKKKKQTVELSVNTDENLMEVEELRKELNSKTMLINEYRKKIDELEAEQQKLQEDLNRVNKQLETVIKGLEEKDGTIAELKNTNKVTTMRMNEHEKTVALLRDELSRGKEVILEKEATERQLEHDLEQARSTLDQLSSKVTELENDNAMLHSKLTGLESLKNDLLETIKKSAQRTHDHGIQTSSTATDPEQLRKDNHDSSQNMEDMFLSPSRFEDLHSMPREEMITRIQELEQMRVSHLKKIKELSDNLSSFRQAVEVVAITLETDSTTPLHSSKSTLRDQDLEQRIRQLCKSELILNLKYLEQEKREATLRLQLHETEVTLKKQTKEYREAIQELEEDLDRARKNEARLKNKLQYGGWAPEDHSLAKIQHLEELVFDLEASERRLKRLLQESQDNEEELKRRLVVMETTQPGRSEERFSRLLPDILDNRTTTDPDQIQKHIVDVERAERRLKQKLDQLLEQEANTNFEEDQTLISSDQPEAALRQKIHELEIIQKVLKHEVVELEHERAELDEITRKDKGLIHELNVKIMKLEQAESNLKQQVERLEETDRRSSLRIDELQSETGRLHSVEKQLKAQLVRAESKETTLSMQLEHAKEDAQRTELKYKQKISELEKERKQLISRADELTDELGDLHGIEMSLKQKVRNLENTEVTLRSKIEELEAALRTAQKRAEELESFNETLSQKIQKLEEEKSAMRFEMSDLVMINNKNADQLNERLRQLQTENKQLREIKACGHDEELAKLRKEINRLSSVSQAHEVLKSNHEHTKKKLMELEKQLTKAQDKPSTKCKYIQVKLTDSFSIHDLEPVICSRCSAYDPEFKKALKNLGARHPEAYQDFVRTLQPPEGRYKTVTKVTGQTDSPTATLSSPPPQFSHPHHSTQHRDAVHTSPDLVVARQKPTEVKVKDNTTTLTQDAQSEKDKVTEESRDPAVRKKYIGQLVDALLLADSETTCEAPLWQVVETFDHEEDEKPYWAEVEVHPVDTMTLSLDVWGLTTDESSSEASGAPCHPSVMSSEAPSVGSDAEVPPLPKSVPPLRPPQHSGMDSFCLPSKDNDHLDGDSADEAPDIVDEDDGLSPLKDAPRAKSVERDSDFSEGSFLTNSLRRHKRRRQMAGSLDSIQDSGHGSLKEDYVIKTMKERIAELEAKIEANKKESSELRSKDILLSDCTNLKKDNHHLKSMLEQKSNELALKVREVEELCEKLKHLQSELTRIQQENTADKKSLAAAEDQLKKLKETEKMYTKLQQEHEELKSKHDELRDKYDSLKEASEEVVNKKKLITELQTKLSTYNKLTLELQSSETKVRALEQKLKDMAQTETSITRQNVKLLHEVDSLKQLTERYQALEEHYNKVKSKFDEALQVRSDALKMVAPLRAKVIRYAKKCKSKDELIHRLMSEMRHCGQHGELTTKAERMLDNCEDYDRPISPMTSQMIQDIEKDLKERDVDVGLDYKDQVCETAKLSGSTSLIRGSNRSDIEALLDKNKPELIHSQGTGNQHRSEVNDQSHVSQVTDDITDVSPQMSLPPITQLKCAPDYLSHLDTPKASHSLYTDRQTSGDPGIYLAVNDYNPELFSTSGQQHREIPLKEGDTVKVLSPANDRGYYEAEVKGQVGLVPALYLVPSTYSKVIQPKVKGYQPPSEVVNSSPEQILTMYAELAKSHVPKFTVPTTCQQPDTHVQSRRPSVSGRSALVHPAFTKSSSVPSKSPLSPSSVVHPAYHRGNQSCDQTKVNTSSSSSSSSINSSRCSSLKIICCQSSATGLQSPPPIDHVRALHKALPLVGPPDPPSDFHVDRIIGDHSVLLSWQPPAMDVFARSNGITIKGYKIYINGKDSQMIPSAHMSKAFIENLNLRQGRTTFSIQTVGDHGQTSRLVEAICVDSTLTEQSTDTDYSRTKSNKHSENSDKKTLCFAVYDYEPSKHSSNEHPTEELSLKAGDVVITYGSQREDGFYHGKVHGKKGLVPASFIEEVPVFSYKNRRITSSNASQVSSLVSRSGSTTGSSCSSIATSERSRPSSIHSNRSTSSTSSRRRSSRKYQAAV